MLSGVQDGEEPPKFRQAREDDKFVIARCVSVTLPAFTDGQGSAVDETEMHMLWSVKSKDIHIDLTDQNLRYCFSALECSPAVEKGRDEQKIASPKKKRRKLKWRPSKEADAAELPQAPQELELPG